METGPDLGPGFRLGGVSLPILHGDRLVGKLDARADRKGGVLTVHEIHENVPFDAETKAAVLHEIEELAGWLRLDPEGI